MDEKKYCTIRIKKLYFKIGFIAIILGAILLSQLLTFKVRMHPNVKQFLFYRPNRLSGSVNVKTVEELSYFENDTDVRKIEKDQVKLEISGEFASEGSRSLKVDFKDGGGGFGFFNTLPSNWAGYEFLKFDVYSPEGSVPLSMFIKDRKHTNYQERFNKSQITLWEGWNHIEVPISQISQKLDISEIIHLRVFLWEVPGSHTLYFDNFHLTSRNDENQAGGPVKVIIHPDKETRKISRLLYGSNLVPKMESDRKIWEFVKNIGITVFRYPGGESNGWHWQRGYSDHNEKVVNMPLGSVKGLVDFARKTETEFVMQVNIETGTPEEAASLVNYMNNGPGVRVDYWELGNEAYGYWDRGYMPPDKYAQTIADYSRAMKAVDPTVKIGANWGGRYYDTDKWDQTIIRSAADHIDFVSFHWYPNHTSPRSKLGDQDKPKPQDVMSNFMEIPNIIRRFNSILDKYAPHRKGKIEFTFTEWDGTWDGPSSDPAPYEKDQTIWSLTNAIFYADTLGMFAANGVTLSTQFNFQECMFGLIRGWDLGEGWGGNPWDDATIRPKALSIHMYSKYFGDTFIESEVINSPSYYKAEDWWPSSYSGKVPYVTAYASKFSGSENKLGVVAINKHAEEDFEVTFVIDEDGAAEPRTAQVWLLTGPHLLAQNDGAPGTIVIKPMDDIEFTKEFKYDLPRHSVVSFMIDVPAHEVVQPETPSAEEVSAPNDHNE